MKTHRTTLPALGEILRAELEDRVLPFWWRHTLDEEHDGLLNCVDEHGARLSTEKYLWSQLRGLWTFSTLARRGGKGAAENRRFADSLFRFCRRHGRTANGEWVFRVSRTGEILPNPPSIFTDGFALLGLAAYLKLSGSAECRTLLQATADSVRARLAVPGSYDIYPYQLPAGVKNLGIAMLFSLAFAEAGEALDDAAMRRQSVEYADDVLASFWSAKDHAVREFVRLDGKPLDGWQGRCCVPGHVIESLWAVIRVHRAAGRTEAIARCVELIRVHLELGWDREFGGVTLAVDLDGKPSQWRFADYKPWWTSVETMYALLLAYRESREAWCLEWYARVHNWAFTHYPVRPAGEWRNRLNRRGEPTPDIIGLPVKDPFHLPRALLFSGEVLEELRDDPATMELVRA